LTIDHLVLVAYFHSDIEVDDFQAKVPVDNEIFGPDVPVGDTVLVKICDTLDEAPADLSDLPIELTVPVSEIIFGRIGPTTSIVPGTTRATR
jgi:hypothetical protein